MSNLTSLSSHRVSDIIGVLFGVGENSLPWRDECPLEIDIRAINICVPHTVVICVKISMALVTFEDILRLLYNHTVSVNTADIIHSEYNAKLIFWLYFGTKPHMTNVKTLHDDSKCVLQVLLLLPNTVTEQTLP